MSNPKLVAVSLAVLAVSIFSGCQTSQTRADGSADSALVMKRAEQRWNYLIEKKAEKAYEYLTPGYRKTKPLEQYVSEKTAVALRWKSATAGKADCAEDVCTVFVTLNYVVNLPNTGGKPIETFAPLREKWLKTGGTWYLLPDK